VRSAGAVQTGDEKRDAVYAAATGASYRPKNDIRVRGASKSVSFSVASPGDSDPAQTSVYFRAITRISRYRYRELALGCGTAAPRYRLQMM
jgi:hypothetical protein